MGRVFDEEGYRMSLAGFLEEESELRTKLSFLAGENQRADALACLTAPGLNRNSIQDRLDYFEKVPCFRKDE